MALSKAKTPTAKTTRKNARKSGRSAGRPARVAVTECVGYIRVSTEDQADSGLSLDNQRARIKAQAEANGWTLVAVHEDAGVSAKTLERPALRTALKELRPGRVLLALKLDRLTRSVPDLYHLDALVAERGAEWATVNEKIDTTTATGRMMRTFIATIAEWERGIIAERTVAALGAKRDRRERLGTTPLGYQTLEGADGVKFVVADADEQETVRLARLWSADGHSLRQIANKLAEQGRPTKRGGKWEPMTVKRILAMRYLEGIQMSPQ